MAYQKIKDFWINKINDLINDCNVQPSEADWQDQINAITDWTDFAIVGLRTCKSIYTNANQAIPADNDIKGNNYGTICGSSFGDLGLEYEELVEVMKTKIGVDPTDATTVIKKINNVDTPYPKWKNDIEKKICSNQGKLTDIPAGTDLTDLLYHNDLYQKIIDNANGLPNLVSRNLVAPNKPNAWGYDWNYGVNDTELQNYKNASGNLTTRENQIKHALNWPAASAIPNTWQNDIRIVIRYTIDKLGITDPTNLPTIPVGEDLASILVKNGEYQRIHTKLNGQASDTDLDNLLNNTPTCSHSDYDTIKSERDTLQTENTQLKEHECDCDTKVAEKEKEIITKIITDLSLSTERERENLLEAVITEIKGKITPPTDTTAKDQKISELETKITNLQAPKSLQDLPISQGVKNEVIKISQDLGLTAQSCVKLEKATSYQELSILQKEAFQEKLNQEINDKKSANYLNWGLGALTLGSLLILAWILIKRTNFAPEIGNKKEEK